MKRIGLIFPTIIVVAAVWVLQTHQTNIASTPKSTTPPVAQFNKKTFSTTDPASPWVIVNKQHPLQPKTFAPADLVSVGNGQFMRSEAATALSNMFAAAKKAGLTLEADSGYRSYSVQVSTYASEVAGVGQAQADSESARPGYSEHQTGWAVDIGGGGCHIQDCFGATAEGKWAAVNAYQYGFILRYTQADHSVTGYRAEAWHFRYIGIPLALELHNENAPTLEQFFNVGGGPNYN